MQLCCLSMELSYVLYIFFIFIHKYCIRELKSKVIVHFAAFIFEFTNVQLEVCDFSFEI